jgi:CDGSH-type Zn-finger protein
MKVDEERMKQNTVRTGIGDGVSIVVRRNGPYRLIGEVRVLDADGREYPMPEGEWVHLCRCGHSGNKPFCDGTHKRIGFVEESPGDSTDSAVGVESSGE